MEGKKISFTHFVLKQHENENQEQERKKKVWVGRRAQGQLIHFRIVPVLKKIK